MSLINHPAPDFTLPDQDGNTHSLSDYAGKYVLLYFYPKDMTPGCTTEAQCFRDTNNDLVAAGLQVLGVSADSIESHKKFAQAHHLNFPLLADTEKTVLNAYGVWQEKSLFGNNFLGIKRESFLIDPQGVVVKHYEKVDPKQHAAEVLEDVTQWKCR